MLDDTAASPATSAAQRRDRRSMSATSSSALMLAPALLLCGTFIFIPAALTIVGSFYTFGLTSQIGRAHV